MARLRAQPLTARGLNTEGERVRVRLDESSLASLIQSGYVNLPMYRDILAAIRAFEAGDRAPLLRLFAENSSTRRLRRCAASPTPTTSR